MKHLLIIISLLIPLQLHAQIPVTDASNLQQNIQQTLKQVKMIRNQAQIIIKAKEQLDKMAENVRFAKFQLERMKQDAEQLKDTKWHSISGVERKLQEVDQIENRLRYASGRLERNYRYLYENGERAIENYQEDREAYEKYKQDMANKKQDNTAEALQKVRAINNDTLQQQKVDQIAQLQDELNRSEGAEQTRQVQAKMAGLSFQELNEIKQLIATLAEQMTQLHLDEMVEKETARKVSQNDINESIEAINQALEESKKQPSWKIPPWTKDNEDNQ